MREQGLVIEGPGVPQASRVPAARSVKTYDDALTPEVAHENAQTLGMLFAQVKGMKGVG